MLARGFNCQTPYVMCSDQAIEDAHHLLVECIFARGVWNALATLLGVNLLNPRDTMQATWLASMSVDRSERKKWAILFSCTCWNLWKQRNMKNFQDKCRTASVVAKWIVHEATLWEKYCQLLVNVYSQMLCFLVCSMIYRGQGWGRFLNVHASVCMLLFGCGFWDQMWLCGCIEMM